MTMNRRQFLKNMGIGAAGAALPGVSMFAANEAMNPQDKSLFKLPELHCDVIVVGAGPAGIPAAVAAASYPFGTVTPPFIFFIFHPSFLLSHFYLLFSY